METVYFKFNRNGVVTPMRLPVAEIELRKGRGVILLGSRPDKKQSEQSSEEGQHGDK